MKQIPIIDLFERVFCAATTAFRRLTGDKFLRSINVQIGAVARMDAAQQQIALLPRQRRRLLAGNEDDFNVLSQK